MTGKCICDDKLVGLDCSFDPTLPPVITPGQLPSICDKDKGGCKFVNIIGDFVDVDTLECQFTEVKVSSST